MTRMELPRPRRRGIPGICTGCRRPAYRDDLGWHHLGVEDAAACRATGQAVGFKARATPGRAVVLAVVGGATVAGLGGWMLTADILAGPFSPQAAAWATAIIWPFAAAGILAGIAYDHRTARDEDDT